MLTWLPSENKSWKKYSRGGDKETIIFVKAPAGFCADEKTVSFGGLYVRISIILHVPV